MPATPGEPDAQALFIDYHVTQGHPIYLVLCNDGWETPGHRQKEKAEQSNLKVSTNMTGLRAGFHETDTCACKPAHSTWPHVADTLKPLRRCSWLVVPLATPLQLFCFRFSTLAPKNTVLNVKVRSRLLVDATLTNCLFFWSSSKLGGMGQTQLFIVSGLVRMVVAKTRLPLFIVYRTKCKGSF